MTLAEYLKMHNISGRRFAANIGVYGGTISKWCLGERVPTAKNMRRIIEATGGLVGPDSFYSTLPDSP